MCGIVGFIDFNKTSTKEVLKKMTNVLYHRGPDARGYFFEETPDCQVGLGHRRLSILDLSESGHQPMFFENLIIVYNGEVYNFKEIKKELEKHGYIFKSTSDTEVILKAFHKWGIDCVHKFRGMWAFAIWDKKNQKLILCRDRAGVKPLYWYYKDSLFMFASELKSFHKHPKFKKDINIDGLYLYFQFGYIPAPYAIFKNTYKLEPGYYLEITSEGIKKYKYWDILDYYLQGWELYIQKYWNKKNEKEIEEELETLLVEAFKYRLVSDVPIGIFLSGGIDSTLVTTLLQKHTNSTLKTFSIGFYEKEYNEAPWAKKIAEYLGTEHEEFYCSVNEVTKIIPKLPEIYDEPFGDSSGIPTYLLSKFTRQKVKVSLSGDGGDELFCGYYKHWKLIKFNKLKNCIPHLTGKPLANLIGLLLKNICFTKYKMRFMQIQSLLNKDFTNLFNIINSFFALDEIENLLKVKIDSKIDLFENNNFIGNLNKFDLTTAMMIVDFKKSLPDQMLVKIDRATMYTSLEGREPLLDNKIVEYVAKMPLWLKYKDGKSKYVLRRILYKYIPSKLIDRPKRGFGIAHHEWFKKYIQNLYYEYLSESRLKKSNIFNYEYIKHLFKFKNHNFANSKLWLILIFEMWKEKWL